MNCEGLSEIGAEYTFAELQQLPSKTVVVLIAEHRPEAYTAWFIVIGGGAITFFAGELNVTLVLFHTAEGDVVDGQNRRIHIHRYLGKN